jgi:alkylhydroperoxidase family enzyme
LSTAVVQSRQGISVSRRTCRAPARDAGKANSYQLLEASRRNNCQFCRQSHIDFIRNMGIAPDPLAAVTSPSSRERTVRERLAIEYTGLAMKDSNNIPDEFFARLKANFTDAEIVELTFTIGLINLLNMFNNCLHVRYHNECALTPVA